MWWWGWWKPMSRQETVALLQGLDVLPPKLVKHRGTVLREFDLDGTLKRRPSSGLGGRVGA